MNSVKKVVQIAAGVLATTMAGCSFRTEIDYSQQAKSATRTPSENVTRNRDQYKSAFHIEAESRINDAKPHDSKEEHANTETEVKPNPTRQDQPPTASPQIIVIQSGPPINITNNNVHIGNINNHTQVYFTSSPTELPERPTATRPAPASPPRLDERCERLRRQHEATVRKWQALFE